MIPGPFVKNTDRAADRTGDHIRYFLFCVSAGSGTGGSSCDIVMKHSQHFFKEIIPMGGCSEDWKGKDFPLYSGKVSENRTDRYRGHFQDEIFPL